MEWWREISPKGHLYPPEILTKMIDEKVKELKKARRHNDKGD
jgi:hypothetical protein